MASPLAAILPGLAQQAGALTTPVLSPLAETAGQAAGQAAGRELRPAVGHAVDASVPEAAERAGSAAGKEVGKTIGKIGLAALAVIAVGSGIWALASKPKPAGARTV